MSKAHRGKGLRESDLVNRSRCPICNRTGIKAIYEQEMNGNKVMVCKQCRASIAKTKLQETANA